MGERRYTRDEARDAIVHAGLELVVEHGPSLGLEHVTFAQAIGRTNVPRPTAYRAFATNDLGEPQARFRTEVAMRLVNSCTFSELGPVLEATADLLSEAVDPEITSERLTWLLREAIRVAGLVYQESCRQDPLYPAYLAVLLAAQRDEGSLLDELLREQESSAKTFIDAYQLVLDTFGVRLRTGWTWPMFASCIGTATTGSYLSGKTSLMADDVDRPTGRDGELLAWNEFGILSEAIFISAVEPDPKMRVSANPLAWVS